MLAFSISLAVVASYTDGLYGLTIRRMVAQMTCSLHTCHTHITHTITKFSLPIKPIGVLKASIPIYTSIIYVRIRMMHVGSVRILCAFSVAIVSHFQSVWTVNTLNNNKVTRQRNRLYTPTTRTPTLPFSILSILQPNPIHARRCRMVGSGHINVMYRIARGLLVQCAYTYTTVTI